MKNFEKFPYQDLGVELKKLREKHSRSMMELSGAVEVDMQKIEDYEKGKTRPAEDVLALIIQHFNLKEAEAVNLWRLAGYHGQGIEDSSFNDDTANSQTKTMYVSAQDIRIVYTDIVQVMVNDFGVVINFLQGSGVNNQPLAVSRVGMSKEHAKSLVDLLNKTLIQAENNIIDKKSVKRLSSPSDNKKQD